MVFLIPRNEPFIIAEIANTHTGSTEKLFKLVEAIITTKADAIKFQFFKADELTVQNHPEYKVFRNLEIKDSYWIKIFNFIKQYEMKICTDVFSIERAKFANRIGSDIFKIHSSDMGNIELLEYVASTKKPVLLSCSGCTLNEIDSAVRTLRENNCIQVILMHGYQGFPTKISDINLNRIRELENRYDLPVGYMDHIDGESDLAVYLPLLALGLNCNIIEKHITLDRSLKEDDYESSLNPDEFTKMVKIIKKTFPSIGSSDFNLSESERTYRKNMKKIPVAKKSIRKNQIIKKKDIVLKRSPIFEESTLGEVINGISREEIGPESTLSNKNVQTKPKVAAILACRVESSRLYAKPLQYVNKDHILDLLIRQLRKAKLVDEIVLAISEKKENSIFVEYAKNNNLKFIQGSDHDVLSRIITAAQHVKADIVFRVTTEDPFVYWEIIDSAIKEHISSKVDFTYTKDLPDGIGFEIINTSSLKKSHDKGDKRARSELVTEYIFSHPTEFKTKPFLVKKSMRYPQWRLTVDYPEDLMLIRKIMNHRKNKDIPRYSEIIKIIKEHPEFLDINKKYTDEAYRNWL